MTQQTRPSSPAGATGAGPETAGQGRSRASAGGGETGLPAGGGETGLPAVPRRTDARRSADGDAFGAFVFRTLRLANLLTTAGDELARPAGQSSARWLVLAALAWGPATVAEVARALGLTRQSVQRVADLLNADELIAFEENPRHRRAKLAQLTPAGRAALEEIQARQRTWADGLGAQIGKKDLDAASDLIGRVMELLTASGPVERSAE